MASGSDGGWAARHRASLLALVLVVVVVGLALVAGRRKPPVASGRGAPAARLAVAFGASVEQFGAGAQLALTNGWVLTSGTRVLAVYAGSERNDRGNGLIVILHRSLTGTRRLAERVLRGTGPVTLLRPSPPPDLATALRARLHFLAASGAAGTLDLRTDAVSLAH